MSDRLAIAAHRACHRGPAGGEGEVSGRVERAGEKGSRGRKGARTLRLSPRLPFSPAPPLSAWLSGFSGSSARSITPTVKTSAYFHPSSSTGVDENTFAGRVICIHPDYHESDFLFNSGRLSVLSVASPNAGWMRVAENLASNWMQHNGQFNGSSPREDKTDRFFITCYITSSAACYAMGCPGTKKTRRYMTGR